MNPTTEQQLETLTQTLATVVSQLDNRRGEMPFKSETKLNTDPARPKILLTQNLSDYDFAHVESARGCKVVAIVQAPEFAHETGNTPMVLMRVKLDNGKCPLVKGRFIKGSGEVSKSTATSLQKTTELPKSTASISSNAELETICAAAFAIESRTGDSPAWNSFCAHTRSQGVAHCVAIAREVIVANPFPVGAMPHEKANHLRWALCQAIKPHVLKAAGVHLPVVASVPVKAPITHAAILARHQLEKSIMPVRVGGKWTLPGIGAYEQEWLDTPKLQNEFPMGPKSYAAYARRFGSQAAA